MAVAAGVLSDTRRRTLEAVCDTFVPLIEVDGVEQVLRAFYARSASDLGVPRQIEALIDAPIPTCGVTATQFDISPAQTT
jgi:hypothetical protein